MLQYFMFGMGYFGLYRPLPARLLLVQEVLAAQNLELLDILLPHLANLVGRLTLHNHLLDVVNTSKQEEHTLEELLTHVEVAVSVDNIGQIEALSDNLVV